jgi:hypothetical protein
MKMVQKIPVMVNKEVKEKKFAKQGLVRLESSIMTQK